MKNNPSGELELYWNLKELLHQRHITRTQDFKEKLEEYGLPMSYAACHFLFNEQPVRVTMKVILTVCRMLKCPVEELLVLRKSGTQPEEPVPPEPRKVVPLSPVRKKLTGGRLKF